MKNIIKIALTITLTALAYRYAKIERGYTYIIGGGESFVPIVCIIAFWCLPALLKDVKGGK